MGPFGLGNGAIDGNMIDLSIVVSPLPLVIKISVGDSDNYENCAVDGKAIGLLRRLMNLERRWWMWICFWFVLLVCVVSCQIGDLWNRRRVGYLWN
jgi:hypothetical protein